MSLMSVLKKTKIELYKRRKKDLFSLKATTGTGKMLEQSFSAHPTLYPLGESLTQFGLSVVAM